MTATQASILDSCYFVGIILFLFPAGILVDRFSAKRLIVLSMTICTLATLIFSLTHILWVSVLCRVVIGMTGSFAFLTSFKIASRWFPWCTRPDPRGFLVFPLVLLFWVQGGSLTYSLKI